MLYAYTLLFIGAALMEVMGMIPQEMKSAGITIEALFSKYFGDEDMHFIYYHIRRTTLITILHCCIPLLYCLGLNWVEPDLSEFIPVELVWLLVIVSVVMALIGCALGYWWHRNKWANHPIAVSLASYNQSWRDVAANINLEYRRIEKFVNNLGCNTVIVTESWIIKTGVHTVSVGHQRSSHLVVSKTEEHHLSMEGPTTSQYLTILVNCVDSSSFSIRLNALQYGELKEKLQAPLREARGVIIRQSLGDQFIVAFEKQVEQNGYYDLPSSSPVWNFVNPSIKCYQGKLFKYVFREMPLVVFHPSTCLQHFTCPDNRL
ncbi:E3 ubiquitin-protein ligase TM129-like isoform X2 [Dysidea avara]|uniref:E3 ubiquitin-protein ligase TM129-like isoform X2 n=1 Tax=Dysidea avara TaxID=196820 RepID=UPI0033199D0E